MHAKRTNQLNAQFYDTQTEATIYLASQRRVSQADWFRSYHTFGYSERPIQKSFGRLSLLNDETLKAGATLRYTLPVGMNVLLLPIVGKINYHAGASFQGSLDVGQAHLLRLPADAVMEISNPYEQELINFLQIWIRADSETANDPKIETLQFDLVKHANTLNVLNDGEELSSGAIFWIGKFDGRKEVELTLKRLPKNAFVFVIDGAFEVQNRLLQARDGLSLTNTDHLQLEALSNEAIILVLQP